MRKILLFVCSFFMTLAAWGTSGGDAKAESRLTVTYLGALETSVARNDASDAFIVPVDVSFLNLTDKTLAMQVGVGYYDGSGQLVSATFISEGVFEPTMGFGQEDMPMPLAQGLPDGTYNVRLLNREDADVSWRLMDRADQYYIEMTVAGNTAELVNHNPDDPSGIHGVEVGGMRQDGPVYNLQGVRMPEGANLPKGVYIKNGKKFVKN